MSAAYISIEVLIPVSRFLIGCQGPPMIGIKLGSITLLPLVWFALRRSSTAIFQVSLVQVPLIAATFWCFESATVTCHIRQMFITIAMSLALPMIYTPGGLVIRRAPSYIIFKRYYVGIWFVWQPVASSENLIFRFQIWYLNTHTTFSYSTWLAIATRYTRYTATWMQFLFLLGRYIYNKNNIIFFFNGKLCPISL